MIGVQQDWDGECRSPIQVDAEQSQRHPGLPLFADCLRNERRLCPYQKQDQVVEPLEGDAMKNRRFTLFLLVVILSVSALTTDSLSADLKRSEPLVIDGKADLTISGLEIVNPKGNGITIRNSKRIRIEGCKIGPCKGEAVNIYACEGSHGDRESLRGGQHRRLCPGFPSHRGDS